MSSRPTGSRYGRISKGITGVTVNFNLSTGDASAQRSGCVVVGVHKGGRLSGASEQLDKACEGALARIIKRAGFDGEVGHALMLTGIEALTPDRVLLIGTGRASTLDAAGFRKLARRAAQELVNSGARDAVSYLAQLEVKDQDCEFCVRESVIALATAAYRFDALKNDASKRDPVALKKLGVAYPDGARRVAQEALAQAQALADALNLCCDLANLPGNICTPSYLADRARQLGRKHDKLNVNVKGEPEMKRMGMGALLSVARGSRQPPRLITMQYQGAAKNVKPIVLIGKGVTF
ncbi:MAG: leucyl aminopeptidase, partial [Gammaproteobacteria bacterium]|nr:leucyl aminopeptidase [Gammaproteobacteria bacterium]